MAICNNFFMFTRWQPSCFVAFFPQMGFPTRVLHQVAGAARPIDFPAFLTLPRGAYPLDITMYHFELQNVRAIE